MPLFIYRGRDSDRGLELRKEHREKHLAHLSGLNEAGKIKFAGPLIDAEGNPCGSVIILEASDLAAASQIAHGDPYLTEGIFAEVEVFETKQVFPS